MEQTGKAVVVAGATGLQGRAVTRHLLDGGWQVRALTRDPNGVQARALERAGAEIVRAEMEDVASLIAAANGAYVAFSYEWLNARGYRADVRATRRIHPGAMDFHTWLERTGAAEIAAFLATSRTAGQHA
ncbi:NmrA family NAD(P)-binding protein [Streptomyces sp. NPDC050448]|uniref:NmrA family NAD(P)-binding protein n=1 Tax=Streptomyces sp. NPDC050448 TaxID=3155404 RepID=UPI0034245E73